MWGGWDRCRRTQGELAENFADLVTNPASNNLAGPHQFGYDWARDFVPRMDGILVAHKKQWKTIMNLSLKVGFCWFCSKMWVWLASNQNNRDRLGTWTKQFFRHQMSAFGCNQMGENYGKRPLQGLPWSQWRVPWCLHMLWMKNMFLKIYWKMNRKMVQRIHQDEWMTWIQW